MSVNNPECVERAVQELIVCDPVMRKAYAKADLKPIRPRPGGYTGLVRIICFQQISSAAGLAIWTRVEAHLDPLDPESVLASREEDLRAWGLSRPKVAHMRAAAQAVCAGTLDFDRIARADDEAARAELVSVKGIGPWSADIYLMFALGRPDVFPAGDLALQESYRRLAGEETRLSASALRVRAEVWRPFRSVAAHLLWSAKAVGRGAQERGAEGQAW